MMMPSIRRSRQTATMSSRSSSVASGAILTSSGTGLAAMASCTRFKQVGELRAALQVAQPRRVGRGDVADEIVGVLRQRLAADDIVGGAIGAVLVGADIDADEAAPRPRGEPRAHGIEPLAGKAHAVDDAAILGQAEQAGPGIALLRPRRDAADLDQAEADAEQGVGDLGILVEARRQADRIGQGAAPDLDGERRRIRPPVGRQQPGLERAQGQAVRGLGVETRQEEVGELIPGGHCCSG